MPGDLRRMGDKGIYVPSLPPIGLNGDFPRRRSSSIIYMAAPIALQQVPLHANVLLRPRESAKCTFSAQPDMADWFAAEIL